MIRFSHPEAFLLLPAWAAALWLLPRADWLRPLRLIAALLLGLAWLNPHFDASTPGLDLWVLVDKSASADDVISSRLPEIQSLLEQSRGRHDRLFWIDYAHEAIVRDPLAAGILSGRRDATRTGVALQHALTRLDPQRNNRLLLLSDGYATDPLDSVAERLTREKIPLDLRLLTPPPSADAAVESLGAPVQVRAGEPFVVEALLRGPDGAGAIYRLFRDGQLQNEGSTAFTRGVARLRWTDLIPSSGAAEYELRIEMEGDTWTGNNRQSAVVEARGDQRILLVTAYADDPLAELLRGTGFVVDLIAEPGRLSAGSLSGAAAVLLNNVPANELPNAFIQALPFFVNEQGGGLVMFGGKGSFGSGGYFESTIDPLLPVSMELKQEHRKLAVAMAIVMDRSGSMTATVGGTTKMDLANSGAARGIELLGEMDAVAVFAVDTEAHEIVPLSTVGKSRGKLLSIVRSIRSTGGGIYVHTGLKAAWKELSKAKQGQRHVILFSDAADSEEPEGVPELIAEMTAAGATISVIALGSEQDSDADFLKDIAARGGGRIFFCEDAATLPAVFAQETVSVSRSAFLTDPVAVLPEAGWREIAAAALEWPAALDGYNLSYAREGAAVSLLSGDEYTAPLLAHWQRGAGRVAAVSFAVAGEYSQSLRNWPQVGDFTRTLARWVARPELPPGLALRSRRIGETLRLELHADDAWMETFAFQPPLLTTTSSLDAETTRHIWKRQGPGRFEAEMDLAAGERLRGALRVGAMTLPFGPISGRSGAEWSFDPEVPRQLRAMSAASGGVERIDLEGVWNSPRRRSPKGIRPLFLFLLFWVFLLEALWTRLDGRVPEWGGWTPDRAKAKPMKTPVKPKPKNVPPPPPDVQPPPTTSSRREAFRRARHGGTLLLLLCAGLLLCRPAPLRAEESADLHLRHYRVPLVEKHIHTRDLLQQILLAAGSGVDLPENFPNQRIPVDRGLANLTVLAWNGLLQDFGLTLRISETDVEITSDLRKIEGNLDQFEDTFCSFFGIERTAVLHSLTPGSSGPPVVLLHGLDSSKRFFAGACAVLAEKGYDVYFFEYPNDDAIRRNAERLSKALKALPEERRNNLSLVTVSMGGLVSQYMLEHEELKVSGVKRLIACVPPFQGSRMAALRGFVEVGDQVMKVVFGENLVPDLFGDGMGRAGLDLQPGSLLLAELARGKRNPEVTYSILAGSHGIVDTPVMEKLKAELEAEANPWGIGEALRRLSIERLDVMLSFQTGRGDGAVTLDSAVLEGVEDRVVLPFHHLQFLSGFEAKEDIPALPEVLRRLPPPR